VLAKYMGLLALMMASLAMVPMSASIWFGEYHFTQRYLTVIILLLIVGLPSLRLERPDDIQHNESLTITALAFMATPLVMSYPIMTSGLSFIDAWFEAVSAVTTTGLTTVANMERMPRTFLFARAWMQWYGGLGIVILSVAIVMNHHIALRRLVNPDGENMVTTTRTYARHVLVAYVALTVIGIILMMLILDNKFYALAYTLAAVSTGGFSPLSSSIMALSWQAQVTIMVLSFLGAVPFILYYRLRHGDWRELTSDIEVRALVAITLLLAVLLTLTLPREMGWQESLYHSTLLAISAQTATGFSSLDVKSLDTVSMGLMIVAMTIGGGLGSTAGGFKVLRLVILLRLIQFFIQRTAMPAHAMVEPKLGSRVLEPRDIERPLVLIVLFIITIVVSWLIFLAYGKPPFPALFEVVSAVGTAGLSSGVTSHELETPLKVVLCIDMLLGRVEIIALLVVLYPGTWLGKRTE